MNIKNYMFLTAMYNLLENTYRKTSCENIKKELSEQEKEEIFRKTEKENREKYKYQNLPKKLRMKLKDCQHDR